MIFNTELEVFKRYPALKLSIFIISIKGGFFCFVFFLFLVNWRLLITLSNGTKQIMIIEAFYISGHSVNESVVSNSLSISQLNYTCD